MSVTKKLTRAKRALNQTGQNITGIQATLALLRQTNISATDARDRARAQLERCQEIVEDLNAFRKHVLSKKL